MSAPRLSGGSSRGSFCRYRISVCSACRRRRLPCADGEARRGTSKRTRHVHGNAIGRTGRRGRRPLPRHHMVTRRIRRMGGSRLSRPRRRGSIARRVREGRACRDRGGAARTRKRHRTRGPPRTSAPTTAPHGNPADTAHGRVALVATEAARVHCATGRRSRGSATLPHRCSTNAGPCELHGRQNLHGRLPPWV